MPTIQIMIMQLNATELASNMHFIAPIISNPLQFPNRNERPIEFRSIDGCLSVESEEMIVCVNGMKYGLTYRFRRS